MRAASGHVDYHEEHYGTTYDGLQPMLDFKASWYLSDHLEPGHAATLVVPGSHLWTVEQRDTWEQWLRPEDVVPIRVPIGSVMLWRNQILHAVAPNLGESERIHLYFGVSAAAPIAPSSQDSTSRCAVRPAATSDATATATLAYTVSVLP